MERRATFVLEKSGLDLPYHLFLLCTLHEDIKLLQSTIILYLLTKAKNNLIHFLSFLYIPCFLHFSKTLPSLCLPCFTKTSLLSLERVKIQNTLCYTMRVSWLIGLNPVGKLLESVHVSSVMFLSKLKQHRPCEVRVYPWAHMVH